MKTRIIWGLILGVLFLVFTMQSLPWILISFGVIHLIAQLEFATLRKDITSALRVGHAILSTVAWLAISLCLTDVLPDRLALVVLAILMLGYSILAVRSFEVDTGHERFLFLLRAVLLITVPLAFIPALIAAPGSTPAFLLLIGASWGADSGAIFTGKLLGRTPLSPRLSPKKTVEGAAGGLLAAGFIWAMAHMLYAGSGHLPTTGDGWFQVLAMFIFGAGISLVGMFGDLVFSMYKRIESVKDYGTIIPGHGGFLDRFDSMLFAAPIVYMFSFILA